MRLAACKLRPFPRWSDSCFGFNWMKGFSLLFLECFVANSGVGMIHLQDFTVSRGFKYWIVLVFECNLVFFAPEFDACAAYRWCDHFIWFRTRTAQMRAYRTMPRPHVEFQEVPSLTDTKKPHLWRKIICTSDYRDLEHADTHKHTHTHTRTVLCSSLFVSLWCQNTASPSLSLSLSAVCSVFQWGSIINVEHSQELRYFGFVLFISFMTYHFVCLLILHWCINASVTLAIISNHGGGHWQRLDRWHIKAVVSNPGEAEDMGLTRWNMPMMKLYLQLDETYRLFFKGWFHEVELVSPI